MKLSVEQVAFYHDNGYLQIEKFLDAREVGMLSAELPNTIELDSPRVIFEDNGSVRSVFAPHFVSATYERLARLDRLVLPSEQLIKSEVYIHQYKINTKKGLKGDWWEWHQDFPYWNIDDGIKDPDLVTIMLYLHDTDPSNGALLLIPQTHKLGVVRFAQKPSVVTDEQYKYNAHHKTNDYLASLNSNIKFTVDHDLIKKFSLEYGIVAASGKKGSALFFHGNIFHASNINLTPFDRDAVLITYNSVNNLPCAENKRPEFLAGRNYTPLRALTSAI